jgi:hypothetical protein
VPAAHVVLDPARHVPSRLVSVSGEVGWFDHRANMWQAGQRGAELQPGDRVRTGQRSRAAFRITDGSLVR